MHDSKAKRLQFSCDFCEEKLYFSALDANECNELLSCDSCGRKFQFDSDLLRQLKQFEALCHQIHASREILGDSSIAIDVQGKQVNVPFNILLTRLSSVIELKIGNKKHSIYFRVDPALDPEHLIATEVH